MTRRIVSFTESGAYVFRNVLKTTANDPNILLSEGEQTSVLFDLTSYLTTGETISSVTATTSGMATPTLTIESGDQKVTASSITPANGHADIIFTLSSGEKVSTRLYVAERSRERADYRGVTYL